MTLSLMVRPPGVHGVQSGLAPRAGDTRPRLWLPWLVFPERGGKRLEGKLGSEQEGQAA